MRRGFPFSDAQAHPHSNSPPRGTGLSLPPGIFENLPLDVWAAARLRNPSGCQVSGEDGPGSVCICFQRALPPDVVLTRHCGKVCLTTGFLQLVLDYAEGGAWEPACPYDVQGGPLSCKDPPPLAWSREEQSRKGPNLISGTNVRATQKLGLI